LQSSGELTKTLTLNLQVTGFREIQSTDLQVFEDITTNQRHAGRLEFVKNISRSTVTLGLEYSDYDHVYQRQVSSSGFIKTSDQTLQSMLRGELRTFRNGERHDLMLGLGNELETTSSDRISGGRQAAALGHLFLQDEWSLTSKMLGTWGFRWDRHSIYGNYLSPKLSLMFKPEQISRIRLSFGQGFRAPSFKELFLDYTVESIGYRILGNANLRPERSNNISLDIERWHTQKYHGRINLFYNRIENLIDYLFIGVDNNLQLWQTANIREAVTNGVEVDLTCFFSPQMEWTLGYAYLNAWDVDNESPINLKAKHKANTSLRLKLGQTTRLNVNGQYIGDRYYGNAGVSGNTVSETWLASYAIWNIHVQKDAFDGLTLNAGIKNLTDIYDSVWGPMPGREWYLGFNYNYEHQ
jgi:outer membrane receptor for ferrienterochelin and colicins